MHAQGCTLFPWDYPDTAAGAAEAKDAADAAAAAAKVVKAKQLPPRAAWDRLAGAAAAAESPAPAAELATTGLLPERWCVARSRAALQRLLPSAQHLAGTSPAAAPSATAAADGDVAATDLDIPALPAGAGAGPAGCLLRVRLRMCGRGGAPPGAAVHLRGPTVPTADTGLHSCAADTAEASYSHQGIVQQTDGVHPAAAAAAAAAAAGAELIGFVTTGLPRGACTWAGATALCCAASLARYITAHQPTSPET